MAIDLHQVFCGHAAMRGEAPFLILPDGAIITYAMAHDRAARIAGVFAALGVRRGDRIAVQVDKSADALLTWLAALHIGAVFLPLNTAYTPGEVGYFLRDAAPALLLHRAGEAAAAVPACLTMEALAECLRLGVVPAPAAAGSPDDPAAILYTSGTTGRSKGAVLSRANLAANAATLTALWRFGPNDVLLHALPIFHTHGLFVATNIALVAGCAMILLPKFDAGELVRLMPRASVLMGVPTFYTRLLAEPGFTRECAAPMRLFVSGSAPLSAETHRAFAERTGHAILERYGMTETGMNTSNPYDAARVPGSVGLPLPDVALRIADPDTGAILPQGDIGVIEVKGPNVFQGYWQMPEKTASEFRADGFFITGDMGRIDDWGYVHIVGRAKDLIICGGFNVYPAEVEALLDAIPGIGESAVIGVPHPDMGEGVVAVVQARDPAPDEPSLDEAPLNEAAVLAALDGRIARFKQPRRVIFLPELPRNAMGKIEKAKLREAYADAFARLAPAT